MEKRSNILTSLVIVICVLFIGIFLQSSSTPALAACAANNDNLQTVPVCQYNGTTSDRVNVTWSAIPGTSVVYSLRWWFTDRQPGATTTTYNQCYLKNWFSGTSAGLTTALNDFSGKYAGIKEMGWHCWPSSLAATTGGIGFGLYASPTGTSCLYKINIANNRCSTTSSTCNPTTGSPNPVCEGTPGQPSGTNMCPVDMQPNAVSAVNFTWHGCSTSQYDVVQVINGVAGSIHTVTGTTFKSPTVDCTLKNGVPTNEGFGASYQGTQQQLRVNLHGTTTNTLTIPFTPSKCPPSTGGGSPAVSPGANHTYLNIALQLSGIGASGNQNPHHPARTVHISIYAKDADPTQPNVTPLYDSRTVPVQFNSNNGYFLNTSVDIGTSLATDQYQIFIKSPGYLRKEVVDSAGNTSITITAGTTNLLPSVTLIAGDIAPLYNTMDAADFYAIVACYKDKATTSSCAAGSQIADINDDGVVDGIDLNYWLLGFQSLQTNNNPQGNGNGATGD